MTDCTIYNNNLRHMTRYAGETESGNTEKTPKPWGRFSDEHFIAVVMG